jgi:hypothetical protein
MCHKPWRSYCVLVLFLILGHASGRTLPCDDYGGITSLAAEATGWFRLGRFDDRDLLVTPAGHGYVALGVNHINAVAREETHALFQSQFHGDWSRFYTERLRPQLDAWSMNNLGYGAPAQLQNRMPYFATITLAPIEKHRLLPVPGKPNSYQFPDVFDPLWQQQVEARIRQVCDRHKENRFLIGYFWTDTPTWDLVKTRALRGTDWVSALRQLPSAAPGKQRYTAFLKDRYAGRLTELNSFYGLALESLEGMEEQDFGSIALGRHRVQADDADFLEQIAQTFYQVAGRAQRRFDPHHLVLGDRYLAGDAPDSVLQAAAPWIDAVSVQPGDRYTPLHPPSTCFPESFMERVRRVTGKPVMICDHTIGYPTREYPKTIFEQMPTQAEAARAMDTFLRRAFCKPYMLGYLRCQYMDRPASYGRGLRQGLVNAQGQPAQWMVHTYRQVFSEILTAIAAGHSPRPDREAHARLPVFELWYGEHQRFGHMGHAQRWINILGHVSPGSDIRHLTCALNEGEHQSLSFREDFHRLARDGDFNVEIDRARLQPGKNRVVLRAVTEEGHASEHAMTFDYQDDDRKWPLPYEVDWSQVHRIQDVVQVVDGKWTLSPQGIRSVEPYYDRVIAFGDGSWRDYEVRTTVTFHRFTPPNTIPNTTNVTHAAIALRWPGHDPDGKQPSVKWYPLGATAEFRLTRNLDQCRWRIFDGKKECYVESERRRALELEKTYRMKHRVETLADGRSRYRVKLWPQHDSEPEDWDLERYETGDLASGSALLLTHHADATFGNIGVVPLD